MYKSVLAFFATGLVLICSHEPSSVSCNGESLFSMTENRISFLKPAVQIPRSCRAIRNESEPGTPIKLPEGIFLVETETIGVSSKEQSTSGTMKVIKNLVGPSWLKDKTFTVNLSLLGISRSERRLSDSDSMLDSCFLSFEKGSLGYWWVITVGGDTVRPLLNRQLLKNYGLDSFPYQNSTMGGLLDRRQFRTDQEVLWKEAVKFAFAVSDVYLAPTDELRRQMLEGFARNDTSIISSWAIATLATSSGSAVKSLFYELAKKEQLNAKAQVMLDRCLCRFDPEWQGSTNRRVMLSRWLNPTSDNSVFEEGSMRISEASETGDLDAMLFSEIVGASVSHADMMDKFKKWCLQRLVREAEFSGEKNLEVGMEFLSDVARTASTIELRDCAKSALIRVSR